MRFCNHIKSEVLLYREATTLVGGWSSHPTALPSGMDAAAGAGGSGARPGTRCPCQGQGGGSVPPMRPAPPRPGSALTVRPASRLSVRLRRQVSLSVRPHLRSSASTVKALLLQGCGHQAPGLRLCPAALPAHAEPQDAHGPGGGPAARQQSREDPPHLGQHVAAVPVHRVRPLIEGGEVGASQHRAGAGARKLPAAPPAPGAGAKAETGLGCLPRPPPVLPSPPAPRRPPSGRGRSVTAAPGGAIRRGGVGTTWGEGWGPTSWCSLWSRWPLGRRWPRCAHRDTGTRGCSRSGRCHRAPSLGKRAGCVAGAGAGGLVHA